MMMTRQGLAAVLVVMLGAFGLRADEPKAKALQVIKKLGGEITRDHKAVGKPVLRARITANGGEAVDLQTGDFRQVLEKPPPTQKSAIQRAGAAVRELGGYIVTEKDKEKRLVHYIRLAHQTKVSDGGLGSLRQDLKTLPQPVPLDLH